MGEKKAIDPFGWAGLALLVVAGVMLITADKLLGAGRRAVREARP